MKNLILSAAIGYNFIQIEFFLKSLRKFYKGEICFIISNENLELEKKLKDYNCSTIKTKIHKKEIQFKRYEIYLDFLKDKFYDQVLLCDSRDIYFQDSPFNFNYKGQINFFLEDFIIENCPFNTNWIVKTYGKEKFDKIAKKTILCSGTVLGNQKKIKEYLFLMCKNISNYKYKRRLKYALTFRVDPEGRGCDQGHANYIVHNSMIDDFAFYSNSEGPFATVYYLKKLNFDKSSKLINVTGKPYLLVHQYDKRWNIFSENFENIKKIFD